MKIACPLITADVPTSAGVVYPKDVLLKAIDAYKKIKRFGTLLDSYATYIEKVEQNVKDLAFEVLDAELIEGQLVFDIQPLTTEKGKLLTVLFGMKIPLQLHVPVMGVCDGEKCSVAFISGIYLGPKL